MNIPEPQTFHEYAGIVHIHSLFSDGSGDIEAITRPALELGLDFLFLTDHMTLAGKEAGWEGYRENLLVAVGYEHHDPNHHNHLLVLGENAQVLPPDLKATEYVARVRAMGCAGFLAHPCEKRKAIPSFPPYPWNAWEAQDFDGIEIWNHLSDWAEQATPLNFLFRIFFPRRFLNPPPAELLARWDALCEKRPVSILGGVDAHAFRYSLLGLKYTFTPYKVGYQSIRTHVLLNPPLEHDFSKDTQRLVEALRRGSSFVSNFRKGDARGFRFYAESGDGCYGPGSMLFGVKARRLIVSSPLEGEIRILRNGKIFHQTQGKAIEIAVDVPGIFRVEVWRKGKAWIYTNPIYIR